MFTWRETQSTDPNEPPWVCVAWQLTLCQVEWRVDQGVQGARRPVAERRREARDQAGEHAELLSLGVALQGLHPQEEEADALATDLQVDSGAQAMSN